MYIEFLLLARDSSIDVEKNTLSVFDLIEDIDVKTDLPEVQLPIQIVCSFRREQETGPFEDRAVLKISGPDGSKVIDQVLPVKLSETHRRCRFRLTTNVPISASGPYTFTVELSKTPGKTRAMVLNVSHAGRR